MTEEKSSPRPGRPERARVLFLDRDGVINEAMPPGQYVLSWEQFRFVPGIIDVLRRARQLGYALVVVTNQRAVGRGLLPAGTLRQIHDRMAAGLGEHGAELEAVYSCPHLVEEHCPCRKPAAGMLHRAEADLGWAVDRQQSFIVGDSPSDMLAGQQFGVRGIYVARAGAEPPPGAAHVVRDVRQIGALLEAESRGVTPARRPARAAAAR
jgi:histidinol-phosphate phosphatase family protein